MVKLQKKQVKIISVLIALVFVGSVVALALTQSGSGLANAASSSVGVVDPCFPFWFFGFLLRKCK